ncbi:MAG TPA: Fe-S cluster assembly protein SufD [Candidatus Acidoferrales bacterium]|jgi:Fe-S cluster assembly protein SufD|nr:Fe-S cluster assembly protein SufD [Candidatus Acidoferrales bacterium]
METKNVATATQALQHYLEGFTGLEKSAASREHPWLSKLRQDAFARFAETGFPTSRDEDWRFTNLSAIAQTPFRLVRESRRVPSQTDLAPYRIAGAACQLVFLDGHFTPELSAVGILPGGVTATNLASAIAQRPAAVEQHLGRHLNIQRDPFSALNTAFIEDGAFVHIPKSVVLEGPVHLLFISMGHDAPTVSHPRNLIVAEENSQATIVEDYISLGGSVEKALCNTATELVAGDHSVISHYMIEREHGQAFNVSTLRIQQGRASDVSSHSVLIGGALVRNNVHPVLAGEGSECLINGLFIGNDRQHLDNYMLVEHASPHCGSRQFYNGILDGHSHGVFHGRIIVHKDAQKTDAKQTNRNLLLSDTSQIDTKPQLEIYADDVKCTHGATIGQIEENALFYLRSRGIDETSARRLLLTAFAGECFDRMKEGPARAHVERLVRQDLRRVAYSSRPEEQLA